MRGFFKILGLVTLLGCLGCHREKNSPAESPAPKVVGDKVILPADAPQIASLGLEPAMPRKVALSRLTGRLVWDENVTVRIFSPVGGRVNAVQANLGETVAAGAVLATIASPDFGQAQADVNKASADLILAQRALNRLQDLLEHGAAAKKDVEAAEDAYVNALSEKERAAARLALFGGIPGSVDQMFSLKTPLPGVVVEKNLNRGQEVRPDQMLGNVAQVFSPHFVISDPTRLWLLLDVTEQDVTALKPGQLMHIYTKAYPERDFPGTLEVIGDSLDPVRRTVMVRGVVPNPDRLLKAEMYVSVDIVGEMLAGVEVSPKAIFRKDNKPCVFVETAPGEYERRAVKLGAETDAKTAILEGVARGQRVVTDGCLLLQTLLESHG